MPACPNCARLIAETAHFCPNCGTGISAPPTSSAPDATPSAAAAPARDNPLAVAQVIAGLPENIAGMLAYFVFLAIAFLLIEPFKRNRFVRFHSIQCLLTVAILVILQIALMAFGKVVPLLVLSLYGLVLLAELTLWLLLLFKAYQHERFKLPVVGDIAERLGA